MEESLGVRLFTRRARSVEVTATGVEYAQAVKAVLDQLAFATERIRPVDQAGKLMISTTPAFAAQWLMFRLTNFITLHPELDVRLTTSNELVDFAKQDVDVAVLYGNGHWPGLQAELLTTTELFPVCSPSYRQGGRRLRVPSDMQPRSLLRLISEEKPIWEDEKDLGKKITNGSRHNETAQISDEWTKWLRAAEIGNMKAEGPQYSDVGLLVQAAIAGQGVALGQSIIVADGLAAGRLIEPFEVRVPSWSAYYVVYPADDLYRRKVKTFSQWLRMELRGDSEHRTAG